MQCTVWGRQSSVISLCRDMLYVARLVMIILKCTDTLNHHII